MAETLLSGSSILMYGRVMDDIGFVNDRSYTFDGRLGHLPQQLADEDTDPDNDEEVKLARIYAVSFSGELYNLAAPTIFLVHGEGEEALDSGHPPTRRSQRPGSTDRTGVAAQDYTFMDDMRVWTYDKNDISLRLDMSTGMLEDILLEAEFGDDMDFPSFGGGKVGGGKVGGGKVGGGKVGGGKVGGGKVGGGKVGGG